MSNPMPKMYRADTTKWEVVEVECPNGTDYPNDDADGHRIYENTHFKTAQEALGQLRSEATAGVRLAGAEVDTQQQRLWKAEKRAAEAAKWFAKVCDLDLPF